MAETSLAAEAPPRSNLPEYTVSELSAALKRRIEESFAYVRVRGEISGWKRHSSGHCYLALKDTDAVIDAVCWRQTALRLGLKPEDGMEVVCSGRLTTFPGRSKYQLVIDTMELAGVGALLKLLEERKQRLAAEGLFAEGRKRKIPFLPAVVGVVTSPTGAVIRDILHRLNDRFPRHVLVWPVAVQGEGAAAQVAAAIEGFNRLPGDSTVPRPDLLIVARGGGSLEDLMAFNEEIVVRAAAASSIPLISAVGHETDTTLIDLAADRRAPTPTAAAEMAVPVRLELLAETSARAGRLATGLARFLVDRRLRIEGLSRGLPDTGTLLGTKRQQLDDRSERLHLAVRGRIDRRRAAIASIRGASHFLDREKHRFVACAERLGIGSLRLLHRRAKERLGDLAHRVDAAFPRVLIRNRQQLESLGGRLDSHALSHEKVLERGYAIVRNAQRTPLLAAKDVTPGATLLLEFYDGEIAAAASGGPRRVLRRRSAAPPPEQGKLL